MNKFIVTKLRCFWGWCFLQSSLTRLQVTTVPLLGNLFLPSGLCLLGAVGYEYLQMEDLPFSQEAREAEEVPEGQALAP